jgi:hypothetical protein
VPALQSIEAFKLQLTGPFGADCLADLSLPPRETARLRDHEIAPSMARGAPKGPCQPLLRLAPAMSSCPTLTVSGSAIGTIRFSCSLRHTGTGTDGGTLGGGLHAAALPDVAGSRDAAAGAPPHAGA